MADGPIIDIKQATKRYADDPAIPPAVDAVTLGVAAGELLVVLGESGSGKTTLLKAINRLVPLTSGTITVEGGDVSKGSPAKLRRRIGYAFQGVGLFPHLPVGDNVAVTPRLLKWKSADVTDRVDELLHLVGLPADTFRGRMPSELSGGQQQRVGVARALAARPGIMLLDEPFGALDPLTRDDLQREYRAIHNELGLTTVMVTHNMTEALLMADRIGVMKDGRMLQLGTPRDLLTAPAGDYVATLMSKPREQADRVERMLADSPRSRRVAAETDTPAESNAETDAETNAETDAAIEVEIEDEPESDTGAPPHA